MFKAGFLKDRVIPGEGKSVHLQLFLLKDNKEVLPPKKLLRSRIVKTIINGEECLTSEYWYEYIEERLAKKLSKYWISGLFPETFAKPIKSGRFYFKAINPLLTYRQV